MTWRRAPLYVRAHDLALWLGRHAAATSPPARPVADEVAGLARDLLTALSLALTFPSERKARQRDADAAVVALRVRVRLLADLGGATDAQARHAIEHIDEIGRMLGGWQLHAARRRAPSTHAQRSESGAMAQAAPTACTAAAATGTTPTTRARPTATGGGPATGTITSASGSRSRRPAPDPAGGG